ncbi:ammonia-dependent NAD(+) synthetase [Georgenia subflava]|uniref:NH(3)-dependent NAD(+) synthetase n=1 Tax=Georgenia subflava TaxID=1622177 RepID=A0A6N7EPB0_9MICO|nr:ammonia-dependent NAD(+) synthetase [Georgenia subflava]MPV38953.1 ammonia-dependent NAD(+) synthetase [Georgenia subflava]
MRTLQAAIIDELGVKPEIDPQQEIEARVRFLSEYVRTVGAHGLVLGISGGLDSTLAGRLAQLAVERLRQEGGTGEFVAERLPYKVQHDENDAQAALRFIVPDRTVTFDIGAAVDGFAQEFVQATGQEIADFNKGNIKARVRMVAQYALAGGQNLLVIGTDHGAESVTGFFTKFGDGAADILPLFGLNKRQNRQILRAMGAEERLWAKVPTADLLDERPGQSDETELGLRYDEIDDYLEGRAVDDVVAERIENQYLRTRHKRTTPVTVLDDWWRTTPGE